MTVAFDPRALTGLPFAKMTGSGNDFVFFDGREVPLELVTSPEAITRICNRYNGVGADGVVVLEPLTDGADVRVHYYNSDGSPADLCGNATLCSTALAAELGFSAPSGMRLLTGAGLINSRVTQLPEIDLQPVSDIRGSMPIELGPGERRAGFSVAGIPHLVLLSDNAEDIDLVGRGPGLRWHPSTGDKGANVNWVSALPDGRWRYRTFERGVEGETLACGTGAVATAILLVHWGLATLPTVTLQTSSGRDVQVTLKPVTAAPGTQAKEGETAYAPTLSGEGRVVFRGTIGDLG